MSGTAGLDGRVAIVTGASRGIGAAAARALAEAGAAIMLAARSADAIAHLAAALTEAGFRAAAQACNVAEPGAVTRLVERTAATFGPATILVNNAGTISPIGRIAEAEPALWAANLQTNLAGPFAAIHAVLPGMLAAGGGVVVNVSSGAAHRPLEGWSAYCAAKAGLAMLTRSLDLEYGALGISAFGFAPGVVDTDMQGEIRASGINPVSRLARSDLAPPDEPARAIAYLCTPAAADLKGREIDIRDPAFRARAGLG